LMGLRAGRGWRRAGSAEPLTDIYAIRVETREDAIFHSSTQQVHLGWRGAPDLDVLGADAIKVLACGGVPDSQLLGSELERQSRGVQVQDLAFAPPQLGLREVAVRVD